VTLQQIITYDSSILGASNSDLKCLYDLHMFLNESVTNADGYDRLLSDYQSSISPFDFPHKTESSSLSTESILILITSK